MSGANDPSQILLINLARSTDRLAFQTKQLSALGLAFERIEAVTPATIDPAEIALRQTHGCKAMSESEIACLLSHAECWRRVSESNAPALILEDDAVISERLPVVLSELLSRAGDAVVQLETFGDRLKYLHKTSTQALSETFKLRRIIKGAPGAAGYVISPRAARNLLRRLQGDSWIADTFLGRFCGVSQYQVVPGLIMQMQFFASGKTGEIAAPTTINAETRGPFRLSQKLRRLHLELHVARLKLTAFLFGVAECIPPCPTLSNQRITA